jgi:hypothetical protein
MWFFWNTQLNKNCLNNWCTIECSKRLQQYENWKWHKSGGGFNNTYISELIIKSDSGLAHRPEWVKDIGDSIVPQEDLLINLNSRLNTFKN